MKNITVSRTFNEEEYNELQLQAVAVLLWGHNLLHMSYDLPPEHVVFYANEVITKGWSRDMLRHALKSEYHLSLLHRG